MKINGLKNLNSNWYDSIMIRTKNDEAIIDVKRKNKTKTVESTFKLSDNLKKLSTEDKIGEIIKYYLRNTKLNGIYYEKLPRHEGYFNIIDGTRKLFIQINKDKIKPDIHKAIIEKYFQDRDNFAFIENSDMKYFSISTSESPCYEYMKDYLSFAQPKYATIFLKKINNKLIQEEENFIISFVKSKLETINECVKFGYTNIYQDKMFDEMEFKDHSGYYIYCNEFTLRLEKELYYKVLNLIMEHNKNIDSIKKLQLTFDDYIK